MSLFPPLSSLLIALLVAFSGSASLRPDFAERVCGWTPGDTILTVPAAIRNLPHYAFADMTSLKKISFKGDRLQTVGAYAFLGCTGLTQIELPASVTSLGEGCFRECTSLTSLEIPSGVKAIPRFMCEWDTSLERVELPVGLEDIGSHAFAYCVSLSAVAIPAGVRHIGSNAFTRCESLREITVPDSVTELESYAFSDCLALERVTLPANSHMLGELLLSGCHSLKEIVELSPEPPTFDCGSPLIEPEESWLYRQCRLLLTPGAEPRYRTRPQFSPFFQE